VRGISQFGLSRFPVGGKGANVVGDGVVGIAEVGQMTVVLSGVFCERMFVGKNFGLDNRPDVNRRLSVGDLGGRSISSYAWPGGNVRRSVALDSIPVRKNGSCWVPNWAKKMKFWSDPKPFNGTTDDAKASRSCLWRCPVHSSLLDSGEKRKAEVLGAIEEGVDGLVFGGYEKNWPRLGGGKRREIQGAKGKMKGKVPA